MIEHGLLACVFSLVIVFAAGNGLSPRVIYERIVLMTDVLLDDQNVEPPQGATEVKGPQ